MTFQFVLNPNDISTPPSIQMVGGKCAQLARMRHLQFSIPSWFCVTTEAFEQFIQHNGIIFPQSNDDFSIFRQHFINASLPQKFQNELIHATDRLFKKSNSGALVVRSSAVMEDTPTAAYAGQFDTFLGITDIETTLWKVKECWASLWSERAIQYRSHQKNEGNLKMAVVIQDFIPSEVSGIMFTANPATQNKDEFVIEASWGLGEFIVGGKLVPDHFVVRIQKGTSNFSIKTSKLGSKRRILQWNIEQQQIQELTTPAHLRKTLTLNEEQVFQLTRWGRTLQSHFGCPQDIEWTIHQNQLYLLQSRPITTLS